MKRWASKAKRGRGEIAPPVAPPVEAKSEIVPTASKLSSRHRVLCSAISGMYVAANVLVAQHFEERRAMACSLVYAASGLSNFVLPPLVEFFRTTYGIRAAFLLYGAIFLNALPPAIVLRSPPWLTNSKTVLEKVVPKADVKKNGTCTCSVVCRENMTLSNTPQNPPFYTQRQPLGNEAVNPSSGVKENSSCAHLCPEKASQKVPEATKFLSRLKLGHTAKQFVTCSFIVYALSFASITFTTGAFVLISADLAVDRGVSPSNSVYFLQAFAVADVAFRAAAGFAIDSSMLSVESTMLLGYVLQGLAYEWLAWASTLPPMIAAAAVLGVTSGSRLSLQAPALVHDFGIGNLPTMMGAVSFCAGASLLMRPLLIAVSGGGKEVAVFPSCVGQNTASVPPPEAHRAHSAATRYVFRTVGDLDVI
ncbi:hypothetical protein HPB51_013342 [Rhipicephalus microplus]|uniref:Monocarboxylate transporter n=1 Tax=Rhipicephalus microplus TaxID=6941 RepID=A0A9J6ETZ1_RHIMP|nr:hypothetical protein HPB51_013342 [Rhipicephalus microplus]